jgi:hypothetical protein
MNTVIQAVGMQEQMSMQKNSNTTRPWGRARGAVRKPAWEVLEGFGHVLAGAVDLLEGNNVGLVQNLVEIPQLLVVLRRVRVLREGEASAVPRGYAERGELSSAMPMSLPRGSRREYMGGT